MDHSLTPGGHYCAKIDSFDVNAGIQSILRKIMKIFK
jgi:hypothetical protein